MRYGARAPYIFCISLWTAGLALVFEMDSNLPNAGQILQNEARGNGIVASQKGVSEWLGAAASAVSEALSQATQNSSRKQKVARPGATASGTHRSPERNDCDPIDSEFVKGLVSNSLNAAMQVMGQATDERFCIIEKEVLQVKGDVADAAIVLGQQGTEIQQLREKVDMMEKDQAGKQQEQENLRIESLAVLAEAKKVAEEAKASAAAAAAPPPGLAGRSSRVSFAGSSAPTATPSSSLPHEMRTEGILAGLGMNLSCEDLVARALEVLRKAGVDPDSHGGPSANMRCTAAFICFKEPGHLRIASDKVRRQNLMHDGRRCWLDARRTRAENRPHRAIHRATEALGELGVSIQRQGGNCTLNTTTLHKNLRRLTVEDTEGGATVCYWNSRLQELTFSPTAVNQFQAVGREADLDQISAWCSVE